MKFAKRSIVTVDVRPASGEAAHVALDLDRVLAVAATAASACGSMSSVNSAGSRGDEP